MSLNSIHIYVSYITALLVIEGQYITLARFWLLKYVTSCLIVKGKTILDR